MWLFDKRLNIQVGITLPTKPFPHLPPPPPAAIPIVFEGRERPEVCDGWGERERGGCGVKWTSGNVSAEVVDVCDVMIPHCLAPAC